MHNFESIQEAHSFALKPRDQHFAEALSFNGKYWVGWDYRDLGLKYTALHYFPFLLFFFSLTLSRHERSLPKEYTTTFQTFIIRFSECTVYFPIFFTKKTKKTWHVDMFRFLLILTWKETRFLFFPRIWICAESFRDRKFLGWNGLMEARNVN